MTFNRYRFFGYGARAALRNALALVFVLWPLVGWAEDDMPDKTVIAFGDSLTQGFGLPEAQGFVPQLQAWLADQGQPVRVVNAGVSGDTTAGGAARIAWTLAEPADLVIVALGGNDVLRGLDPGQARANLTMILQTLQGAGVPAMLVGMRAPGNFGADYQAQFDAIYPDLAAQFDVPLYPFFLAALEGDAPTDILAYLQPDGLHPTGDGVARIVADMGPVVQAALAD